MYTGSTIQLTRTGKDDTTAMFYPTSAWFRISDTEAWVTGTFRGGTCNALSKPESILTYQSHLPCQATGGQRWCSWRGKEGKQEMFCFTKWHIPNSVENYTWMPEMPRQRFCVGKGNSILHHWRDLVLHVLHKPWWGASSTVPPFTSPWQMHLVLPRSIWVFEIYLGPLRCHIVFWH